MFNNLAAYATEQNLLIGGVALLCLLLGWWARGLLAGRRENQLKQAVLEAKRSIPQFESSVRSREQAIDRLQLEAKDLRSRMSELDRTVAERDIEIRNHAREVRVLTTELQAAKRVQADDTLFIEGIDTVSVDSEVLDPQAQAQLQQSEAMYAEIRSALEEREQRILELESTLSAGAPPNAEHSDQPKSPGHEQEIALLEDRLRNHEATIERLEAQLSEIRQDRNMLSGLARSRAKQRATESEPSSELIERITHLERELDLRNQVVMDRDASLKRLLGELEEASRDRAAQQAEMERCLTEMEQHSERAELEERVSGLVKEIDYLRSQVEAGQRELSDVRHELRQSESWLDKYKASSARRATELAELRAKWDAMNDRAAL